MRALVVACVLASSTASAGRVATWTETGTADIDPAVVHGRLAGTTAMFTARYLVPVERGFRPSTLGLALPPRGLVTGATVSADGVTHRLQLLPAQDADDRFLATSGETGAGDPPWAVLLAGDTHGVQLGFASPHGGFVSVTLEIEVPTCYERDTRYVAIPAAWTALDVALREHVTTEAHARELATSCGVDDSGTEHMVGFPVHELAALPSGERISATAGRLSIGTEHIVKVELDLASVVADVPRDLATVIVVDASRSMTAAQVEAQKKLVLAYVKAAATTRVQVIAFARTARPLLPTWSVASQALPRLERELDAIAPRNGSNVDVGLAEAGAWLQRITGTHRVVVLTDELLAARLQADPGALTGVLPAGTLVHAVLLDTAFQALVRDDDTLLAPLAKGTEGLSVRAGLPDDKTPVDPTMLLRPIQLDQVAVTAPGWTSIDPDSRSHTCAVNVLDLPEGDACTWWGEGTSLAGPVAITGLLWNRRITRVMRPDPAQALPIARELSALGSLGSDAQARIDRAARAVNSAASLFARWGGHGSFAPDEASFSGCGCDGGGTSGGSSDTIGTVRIGHGNIPVYDLHDQLARAVSGCHLDGAHVTIELEMTMLEIVDVRVTLASPAPALEHCIVEALWDASPMLATPRPHDTFTVKL